MAAARFGPSHADGYEIVEAEDFLNRVQNEMGGVRHWDEIRWGLDIWMNRRPKELPLCRRIRDDLWFARVKSNPLTLLLYEVRDAERIVTYLDLRVFPDAVADLDPEFDELI